ncbi:hypothetical protein BSL78_30290, partial [Apostichopus japonicus]
MDVERGRKDKKQEEEDAWKAALPALNDGPAWHELSWTERTLRLIWVIVRIILFLGFLYLFVCALSFLSSAFRLVGGIAAGKVLNNHELLNNPIAALMVGVLVTVLVQSSSTSTSIVVALVGSGLLDVGPAIPVIMGANIGTSVTNTIVAIVSGKIVKPISSAEDFEIELLKAITDPFTKWVIQIDKKVITKVAQNAESNDTLRILKVCDDGDDE